MPLRLPSLDPYSTMNVCAISNNNSRNIRPAASGITGLFHVKCGRFVGATFKQQIAQCFGIIKRHLYRLICSSEHCIKIKVIKLRTDDITCRYNQKHTHLSYLISAAYVVVRS